MSYNTRAGRDQKQRDCLEGYEDDPGAAVKGLALGGGNKGREMGPTGDVGEVDSVQFGR